MKGLDAESEKFQRRLLLATVAVVSILFLWMILDFLGALLLAAIFAGLLTPVYRWLLDHTGGRAALSAGLVVVGALLLVIGPLTTFLGLVTAQAIELSQSIGPWIAEE